MPGEHARMSVCSSSSSAVVLVALLNPAQNAARNLAVFLLPAASSGCVINTVLQLGNSMANSLRGGDKRKEV